MELIPPTVPSKPERISELMRRLTQKAESSEVVSIGSILQLFGVRGFAFLLLMLSLLNIVIFMVPLISVLFGVPMVILAVQILLGLKAPIFPRLIRQRTLRREALAAGLDKAIYWVEKIERYIQPRLAFLSGPRPNRVHGLLALVMAVMVTLPVPLFNVPPSVALVALALGMLQRDGLFIVAAYAIGLWCLFLFKSLGHLAHALA